VALSAIDRRLAYLRPILAQAALEHSNCQKKMVAINDALPLNAARRDDIAKLKSFGSFESELHTNPVPFHLDSL